MPTSLLLLGDSHMAAIHGGALQLGLTPIGGATIPANLLNRGALQFDPGQGLRFISVERPGSPPVDVFRKRFLSRLKHAGIEKLNRARYPVITDFGSNIQSYARPLKGYSFAPHEGEQFLSRGALRAIILDAAAEMLKIVDWLVRKMPVVCCISPPMAPGNSQLMWRFIEEVLFEAYRGLGAQTYSSLDWSTAEEPSEGLRPEYRSGRVTNGIEDKTHGNAAYGSRVISDCLPLLGLNPADSLAPVG